jgi:hypothetical protein
MRHGWIYSYESPPAARRFDEVVGVARQSGEVFSIRHRMENDSRRIVILHFGLETTPPRRNSWCTFLIEARMDWKATAELIAAN